VAEVPEVTEPGLNAAVAPDGTPVAENETVWAEPDVVAVFTVVAAPLPAVTDADAGLTAIEKSFVGVPAVTVKDTLVVWVAEAPVPVTVTG
jgi:hypothetical protein